MLNNEATFTKLRREMVRGQIIRRGITAPRVIAAMEKVPRHLFVSEALKSRAYEDHPLPIGKQQTISQPFIVAEMTRALQLTPDDRVLEVGTGSGYQAAVLAEIACRVYTVERIYDLHKSARKRFDQLHYHNIVTHYADGTTGWQEESPFDAVVVTAGAPEIPVRLVNQLAIGGRLVIPVGNQHSQDLVRIIRTEKGVEEHTLGACRFVKLIGAYGWQPADA